MKWKALHRRSLSAAANSSRACPHSNAWRPILETLEPRVVQSTLPFDHAAVLARHAAAQKLHDPPTLSALTPSQPATSLQKTIQAAQADPSGTWTVMVYVNGDDLNQYIDANIRQMEQVVAKAPSNVKIVVLYSQPTLLEDRAEYPVYETGNGKQEWDDGTTTGYAVLQAPAPGANLNIIYTTFRLSRSNVGETQTLENFIVEAEQQFPAQNYALIFGDHGAGVQGFNYDKNFQAIGAKNFKLTTNKLVTALSTVEADGDKLNLLAFDECMMAMPEVEYAVRNLVPYVVASEELIAGPGFNYVTALAPLTKNPAAVTPADLALSLVASFDEYYKNEPEYRDTLSAVQTSKLGALASALRTFVADTASASPADWAGLRKARAYATKFGGARNIHYPYRDLGQFLAGAAAFEPSSAIRSAAESAVRALQQAVIDNTNDRRQSSGLSIVLPTPGEQAPAEYAKQSAAFLRATGWLMFLHRFQTVGAGAACADPVDWAEYNNQPASATTIGPVSGSGIVVPDLTLPRGDVDWYSFSLLNTAASGDVIKLESDSKEVDSTLQIYPAGASSNVVAEGGRQVSLSGLSAGAYLLKVSHGPNMSSFAYSLRIDAPAAEGLNDRPAQNVSFQSAQDLGTVINPGLATIYSPPRVGPNYTLFNRTAAAQSAWYKFETPRSITPLAGSFRVLGASATNLTVTLYNEQGRPLRTIRGRKIVQVPYRATGAGESLSFSVGGGVGTYEIFFSGLA